MRFTARLILAPALTLIVGLPADVSRPLALPQQSVRPGAGTILAQGSPDGHYRDTASISPELLRTRWKAQWIRPAGASPKAFGVYHFRKTFELPSVPERFVIHVTADNRYELYVNGRRLLAGPARGDLDHWRFDTIDIARALAPGRNVLAAVVWNFAEDAPMAQVTHETGFLV